MKDKVISILLVLLVFAGIKLLGLIGLLLALGVLAIVYRKKGDQ